LLRLERIHGRIDDAELNIAELDEALLAFDDVVDFAATLRLGTPPTLCLEVSHLGGLTSGGLRETLSRLPGVAAGSVCLTLTTTPGGRLLPRTGKRRIAVEADA
jgi:hypothetical protein